MQGNIGQLFWKHYRLSEAFSDEFLMKQKWGHNFILVLYWTVSHCMVSMLFRLPPVQNRCPPKESVVQLSWCSSHAGLMVKLNLWVCDLFTQQILIQDKPDLILLLTKLVMKQEDKLHFAIGYDSFLQFLLLKEAWEALLPGVLNVNWDICFM